MDKETAASLMMVASHGAADGQPAFDGRVEFLAALVAGFLVSVLFYPLEFIEARMQVSDQPRLSLWAEVKRVLQQNGWRGLYVGVVPTSLGASLNSGLYFYIYECTKLHYLSLFVGMSEWYASIAAAVVAGVISSILINPFWVLKIRAVTSVQHAASGSSLSMPRMLLEILQKEGVLALWAGQVASLAGVLDGVVGMVAYEQLMKASNHFIAGGLSRAIAILCTYPIQLIRSKLMKPSSSTAKKRKEKEGETIGNTEDEKGADNVETRPTLRHRADVVGEQDEEEKQKKQKEKATEEESLGGVIAKVYREKGVMGFYDGILPNLLRSVPPSAFYFVLASWLRSLLRLVLPAH
ncbi:Mitochondrial substrate carrier family protein [Balamuthia mandrillaris]